MKTPQSNIYIPMPPRPLDGKTDYSALEQKCLTQACAILDKLPEHANQRLSSVLAANKLLEMAREAAFAAASRNRIPRNGYNTTTRPHIQLEETEESTCP